jgi:hypothetical protein
MTAHKLNNIFSDEELQTIKKAVDAVPTIDDPNLGRVRNTIDLNHNDIIVKLEGLANSLVDQKLYFSSVSYAHYSNLSGEPNLPPHFDSDTTDLIIDYQLEANISWDLGINTEVYPLEDNSAIVFNPNTNIHWRPHRRFEDGEYVKMLFFRFGNAGDISDYGHTDYSLDHPIFDDARRVRDSYL